MSKFWQSHPPSPSATHTDTSCCSHKAVPVRHNCSGVTCLHKEFTVSQCSSSTEVNTSWAVTQHVAGSQGGNAWELDTCMFFVPVLVVCRRDKQETADVTFWGLHYGVWASQGCWKPCAKSPWRCPGRSRHLDKNRDSSVSTADGIHILCSDVSQLCSRHKPAFTAGHRTHSQL